MGDSDVHFIGVDVSPNKGVDFIMEARADEEGVAGGGIETWPRSAELCSGLEPRTDRGVKITMVIREAVEEATPDRSRCLIGAFLVNFLKDGFALTP